ncbi:MAG: hypothetical protein AAF383_29215 [Cyanobacteria bacterium P01_A01_bin.83]
MPTLQRLWLIDAKRSLLFPFSEDRATKFIVDLCKAIALSKTTHQKTYLK